MNFLLQTRCHHCARKNCRHFSCHPCPIHVSTCRVCVVSASAFRKWSTGAVCRPEDHAWKLLCEFVWVVDVRKHRGPEVEPEERGHPTKITQSIKRLHAQTCTTFSGTNKLTTTGSRWKKCVATPCNPLWLPCILSSLPTGTGRSFRFQ